MRKKQLSSGLFEMGAYVIQARNCTNAADNGASLEILVRIVTLSLSQLCIELLHLYVTDRRKRFFKKGKEKIKLIDLTNWSGESNTASITFGRFYDAFYSRFLYLLTCLTIIEDWEKPYAKTQEEANVLHQSSKGGSTIHSFCGLPRCLRQKVVVYSDFWWFHYEPYNTNYSHIHVFLSSCASLVTAK